MRTIVRTQGASVTARLGFGRILFSTRRGRNGTLFTDVPRRRLPEAAHALSGGAHDEPDAAGSGFAAAYAQTCTDIPVIHDQDGVCPVMAEQVQTRHSDMPEPPDHRPAPFAELSM